MNLSLSRGFRSILVSNTEKCGCMEKSVGVSVLGRLLFSVISLR